MKLKILTLLSVFAVVLSARAVGEPLSNLIGFEQFGANYKIDVQCDDSGQGSDVRFWQSDYKEQTAIVGAYLGTGDSYVYKPDEPKLVEDGPGNKYVLMESSINPLYRTSVNNIGFLPSHQDAPAIGNGIIIDTLMEFSAIDGLETPTDFERAKILVWLGTDGGADTNLYVTAGSIGESDRDISRVDFKLDIAIEPDSWHRLTVRAIDNIITDEPAVVGFEIFIDGDQVPVACAESSANDYAEAFNYYLKGKLNATAKVLYEKRRLFPSLIAAGTDDANVISAAGFNGVGKIDDLSIVDYASGPAFAQGGVWTLKWTEGVTGFKLNGEAVSIEGGAKEIAFTGASDRAVITDVTYDETVYKAGTWTTEGGATLEGDTFTITAANAVCTIVVNPKPVGRFTVGGKSYSLLSEVFADDLGSDPITIELADDFSTELETSMEEGYLIGSEMPAITLDLKGHTITKEGISGVLFTINEECKGFTLIDTVGGGKMVGDAEGLFNISGIPGTVTIGNLENDKGVTIETVLTDEFGASEALSIVNGSFKNPENTTDGAFSYMGNLAKGRGCELKDGYWKITQGGTYKLKWTEGIKSFKAGETPMEVTKAGEKLLNFVGESTTLKITEVIYVENYQSGAWIAEGGATLLKTTFTITSDAEDPICTIVAEAIPPPPASINFTATFGEGVESAMMNGSPLTTDPVEVDFETPYTIEPTLEPWYIDAAISEPVGITTDGLSFIVNAGAEAASATISAKNAKDSTRSASEIAAELGIENDEATANDKRFKEIIIWAQGKGYLPKMLNEEGFNLEYLLNDFDGEFKITSIAVDSATGEITIGKPGWEFNGVLHVQGKALLTDDWSDCTEPKITDGYNFFRLELRFE